MSNSNCNDIDGFTRRRFCRPCDSRERESCCSDEAYGSVFSCRERQLRVQRPSEEVPITFDHNAMLRNMVHNSGSAELKTCRQGDYKIDFVLYLYSENSSQCSFILEADEKAMSGGVFTSTLSSGHQVCSGSTMASLGRRDDIRLLFTAPSAMQITVVNATLSAVKMN